MNHGWTERWSRIERQIVRLHSEREVDERLLAPLVAADRARILAFVNAHAMNRIALDEAFYRAVRSCDVVVRDGSGVALHFRIRGLPPGLNLNGTDLIPRIIGRFDGRPIALLGTREPYLGAARDAIRADLAPASRVDIDHGFHDPAHYVRWVLERKPQLIVLGMGMPKQERLAALLRDAVDHPCLIVCGGAIVDFLGGRVARAPRWIRRLGMEWAYRLSREPRRLFGRYVVGNPAFVMRSLVHLRASRRKA